jgi:GGDEF domain-containing protein
MLENLTNLAAPKIDINQQIVKALGNNNQETASSPSILFDCCQAVIEQIYGDEINNSLISILNSQQIRQTNLLFKSFFSLTLDRGALVPHSYEQEKVLPAPVFRRSAFVDIISRKANIQYDQQRGYLIDKDIRFYFFDIKDFRLFDLAIDNQGNHYADLLINKIVSTINVEINKQSLAKDVFLCRYGGDEFFIGGIDIDEQRFLTFSDQIKTELEKLKGYYKNPYTNQIEEGRIKLNELKQHLFTILKSQDVDTSEENFKKHIFLAYFKRGLILNNDEVERVKVYLNKHFNVSFSQVQKNIYSDFLKAGSPKEIINQKIRQLTKVNPQFAPIIYLAQAIDEQESGMKREIITQRTQIIIEFIENVVYDPLLEYNVYSFTDFFERLRHNKLKMLQVIDFKFLKEINDLFSMVEGDEIIKSIWHQFKQQILQNLAEETRTKIIIGRRGGTFFIGLDAGAECGKDELIKLKELINNQMQSITITLRDKTILLPLGLSRLFENQGLNHKEDKRYVSKMIDEIIKEAESDWYKKIGKLLEKEQINLTNLPKSLDLSSLENNSLIYQLFNAFFSGKRSQERLERLFEVQSLSK